MTVNDEDESILELFQDYKKFCQNRINDPNSSKEVKVIFFEYS